MADIGPDYLLHAVPDAPLLILSGLEADTKLVM